MPAPPTNQPLRTDGKYFQVGGRRVFLRAVSYGPFPGGWPADFSPDFRRIRAAGFDTLRLYEMPDVRLLDAAGAHGLRVFAGLQWGQNLDFSERPELLSAARVALDGSLAGIGQHPALAGVFVANEIPADLVRWMGPLRSLHVIEELIELGRERAPQLLFAYANYPSTEYLEPANADFTAFNIYLENEGALQSYLKRLQHIAGNRPLMLSEFGLDSRRNGLTRQASLLRHALEISYHQACAGFTAYSWSDRWWNNGATVEDWDFGLTDRAGQDKPALEALATVRLPSLTKPPSPVSVIVCTRNGRQRIGACIVALRSLRDCHEIIVVDDGSNDGTADHVARHFPSVKLVRLPPCGLSAARNAGAAAASGEILAFTDDDCQPDAEWLQRLGNCLADGRFAAAGGPNIPPSPRDWHEAVVYAAPGGPSHVMLDDEEAEHLPGCNLAVTRAAFVAVGGFDPAFHTAGDDVDFCWRLRDAGFRLGFAPGAFVWHSRRPHIRAYLRQQYGYGCAERLLRKKHPQRYNRYGAAIWSGCIYAGGTPHLARGAVIYHGSMGMAGYQHLLPAGAREPHIPARFLHWKSRLAHAIVTRFAPLLRSWARSPWRIPHGSVFGSEPHPLHLFNPQQHPRDWKIQSSTREELLEKLLAAGWQPGGPTDPWDVQNGSSRLLIATERDRLGLPSSLVRLWGMTADLPDWLSNGAGWKARR